MRRSTDKTLHSVDRLFTPDFAKIGALVWAVLAVCTRQLKSKLEGARGIMTKILIVLVFFDSSTFAKQRSGSFKGKGLDELGGAIVGVTVTAIDSTGAEKNAVTNNGGVYTLTGLPPGKYTIHATNPGF